MVLVHVFAYLLNLSPAIFSFVTNDSFGHLIRFTILISCLNINRFWQFARFHCQWKIFDKCIHSSNWLIPSQDIDSLVSFLLDGYVDGLFLGILFSLAVEYEI